MNQAVEEFRRLAEEYCTVVERPSRDRLELQEALMELLPRLYLAASALPLTFISHWGRHAVNALAAVHGFYW